MFVAFKKIWNVAGCTSLTAWCRSLKVNIILVAWYALSWTQNPVLVGKCAFMTSSCGTSLIWVHNSVSCLFFINCYLPVHSRHPSCTLDVSQEERSWLKLDAPLNMQIIAVTLDVSQEERGWLKLDAPENMWRISVTLDVFQEERGWLKLDASLNMQLILVTLDVSQEERGWLKLDAP